MILFKISRLTDRVYGELIEPIPKITLPQAKHNLIAFPVVSLSNPLLGLSFLILCLSMCSCGATRTIPIETIRTETKVDIIYLSNIQYDSIYISQDLFTDRSKDTILIRQHDVEYRYKLIRDTVERVKIEIQRDSIPYEVRIETIKEVSRKSTSFDIICYCSFAILLTLIIGITILMIIPIIKR